ncbi:phosphoribosylamine--glycine ligase [Candidatus Nomurabacteria bacterium]|nr:phosphoribosylamine--glycine ligase [Candidatus Nomurabacteria bacterium]
MLQNKKVLIIGSGGREHAVGWKLDQSLHRPTLYFAPGNAGTKELGTNLEIKATDIIALLEFAKKENIYMTLALPDDPLALGIVDLFRKNNLRIWGPTKEASKLEWSKAFAKDFMHRHNLPTSQFRTFTEEQYNDALSYIDTHTTPVVVKASGLALGKGVLICLTREEAKIAVENILIKKIFGDGGSEIVIEEFLLGPEISTHAISDGVSSKVFPSSQDHKKIGIGDTGLNTGGMGTIAPVPFVDENLMTEIKNKIILPTLVNMEHDGIPFEGILYPGLIITSEGPKIIEFNSRFGDPEVQTYMRLLDVDIFELFDACIEKELYKFEIKWKNLFACNIVLASGGYPNAYEKGKVISGIEEAQSDPDIVIFHAGTTIKDGNLVTNGGRVMGVSATGITLQEALDKAYKAIQKIYYEGIYYRDDIGKRALHTKL